MIYVLTPSKPASAISPSNYGYYQLPSPYILACLPMSRYATLCWKLLKARSILEVSTHVSSPNNNTACITALKIYPNTFRSAPSWLKIRNNRLQLFLTFLRLPTTACQSSSTAIITRPRYLNTVTFSKGASEA